MTTKTRKDWTKPENDELWGLTWLRNAPKETPVYGIVRSVSRSGMSRRIDFYAIDPKNPRPIWLTPVFRDVLGLSQGVGDHDGLRVNGAGMDMIFACVYNLGSAIHNDGYYFRSESL